MARAGSLSEPSLIRELLPVKIEKAVDDSRTLEFVISTDDVDRIGDTIAVDGWRLDAYRKNPVVLWSHDSDTLPVARALAVWTENKRLRARAEFTSPELNALGDKIYRMYRDGFLNAVSVGFAPLKWAFTQSNERPFGIDFMEHELLEFSAVSVPANADALIQRQALSVEAEETITQLMPEIARAAEAVLVKHQKQAPPSVTLARRRIELDRLSI